MSKNSRTDEVDARRLRHKHDGWIGVDLDGTLAYYTKWEGPDVIGAPIPLMLERVKRFIAEGYSVRILTARVSFDVGGVAKMAIERWCAEHVGLVLPVTCVKDYEMIELWDDRAIQVVPNTGRTLAEEHLAELMALQGKP